MKSILSLLFIGCLAFAFVTFAKYSDGKVSATGFNYQVELSLELNEFQSILEDSGLSERRPMEDPQLLERMIKGANLLITARSEGQLVGLLRGLSDFCYRSFIADLAVARSFLSSALVSASSWWPFFTMTSLRGRPNRA